MNFKLMLWKTIISIIVGLTLGIIISGVLFPCTGGSVNVDPDGATSVSDPTCAFYSGLEPLYKEPSHAITTLLMVILTYSIWSLFQKKK